MAAGTQADTPNYQDKPFRSFNPGFSLGGVAVCPANDLRRPVERFKSPLPHSPDWTAGALKHPPVLPARRLPVAIPASRTRTTSHDNVSFGNTGAELAAGIEPAARFLPTNAFYVRDTRACSNVTDYYFRLDGRRGPRDRWL